jgi:HK97 family phage portal protein
VAPQPPATTPLPQPQDARSSTRRAKQRAGVLHLEDRSNAGGEPRSLPRPENELPLLGAYTAYGAFGEKSITPANALAIGDVWAAVRVLADAASSLPLHVYRDAGAPSGTRERVRSGRLPTLLGRPAPATSQADLVCSLMAHLAVYGNGYIAKYREGGEITQLGLLHPDRIRPELEGGVLRFRYTPGGSAQRMLTTSDVTMVRGLSMDGLTGLSAVSQAARVIGLSDELVRHALAFFERGTERPAGVLQVYPDMSEQGKERLREALRNQGKPHGLMVIDSDAAFHELTSRLDDAQFSQQRELSAREIARVFRIPAHMLGAPTGDSLTYANTEQLSLDFTKFSLQPWLRRIELAISNDPDLCFERTFVKFELDGLLRADAKTRAESYSLALNPLTGWMSREEVRRLEDLSPEPQGAPQVAQLLNAMPQEASTNGNS